VFGQRVSTDSETAVRVTPPERFVSATTFRAVRGLVSCQGLRVGGAAGALRPEIDIQLIAHLPNCIDFAGVGEVA
jgi:hypothetical protein